MSDIGASHEPDVESTSLMPGKLLIPKRIVPAVLIVLIMLCATLHASCIPWLTLYMAIHTQLIVESVNGTIGMEEYEIFKTYIFISNNFGICVTNVIGGILAEHYGARTMVFYAILSCSCILYISPWGMMKHQGLLILFRFINGMCLGLTRPALIAVVAEWAPLFERTMFTWCTRGEFEDTITYLTMFFISRNCEWITVCYIIASFTAVLSGIWFLFLYDSPLKHPHITHHELSYIKEPVIYSVNSKTNAVFPVWDALGSTNFYILLGLYASSKWVYRYNLFFIYKHVEYVADLNLIWIGSSFATRMVISGLFAVCSDVILSRKLLSTTCLRKIMVTFSHVIPALLMFFALILEGTARMLCTFCVMVMHSISVAGHHMIPLDQAPNYAASVSGLGLALGSVFSVIYNAVSGFQNDYLFLPRVWYLSCSAYLGAGLLFVCFGTAKLEMWNWPENCALRMVTELHMLGKLQDEENNTSESDSASSRAPNENLMSEPQISS